jgi:hypothetical protein
MTHLELKKFEIPIMLNLTQLGCQLVDFYKIFLFFPDPPQKRNARSLLLPQKS